MEGNKSLLHSSTDVVTSSFARRTLTRAATVNQLQLNPNGDYSDYSDDYHGVDAGGTGRAGVPVQGGGFVDTTEWTQRAALPATYVKTVMATIPVDPRLLTGIRVTKVTTRGKCRPRVLTISRDRFAIFCTHKHMISKNKQHGGQGGGGGGGQGGGGAKREDHEPDQGFLSTVGKTLPLPFISRKGILGLSFSNVRDRYVRYLDVCDVDFINVGYPSTHKLEASRSKNRLKGYKDRVDKNSDQLVSIIYQGNQTLDFFIPDEEERQLFVTTLQTLLRTYHNSKLYVANEARLIRYCWYDVDQNADGMVGRKEFNALVNRINLNVPYPSRTYQAFVKHHRITKGTLTYKECMHLLCNIKEGNFIATDKKKKSPKKSNTGGAAPPPPTGGSPSSPTFAKNKTMTMAELYDNIWTTIFGANQKYVSAKDFLTEFLHKVQKEYGATEADVKALFASINRMEVIAMHRHKKNDNSMSRKKQNNDEDSNTNFVDDDDDDDDDEPPMKPHHLTQSRFICYLHHVFNMAFDPDQQELDPDTMTRPLTEYWINSSHNTYLMGDQLQSISSVEMYMLALQRGCKCLELDCWDGERSPQDNKPLPIIFHGGTLTGKILFEDVIQCVATYMRNNPDTYPIILSLETHCSKPFQLEMATLLKNILQDVLYAPFSARSKDPSLGLNDPLPSPEQLRGRVIVKGKRPDDATTTTGTRDADIMTSTTNTSIDDDDDDDADQDLYELAFAGTGQKMDAKGNFDIERAQDSIRSIKKEVDLHSSSTVPELAELTLLHGCKFKKWEKSLTLPNSHMHSIGESKITKLINKGGGMAAKSWRQYNETHMTRTYPAGTRVDSSNYNPILAWSMGCQLVALNFQTSDTALLLNDGRFRQNGKCGYVLKPPSLLASSNSSFTSSKSSSSPMKLSVRILCGSCLPKPNGAKTGETIDPYVLVTVHDVVVSDKNSKKEVYKATAFSTPAIDNNGFCPVWNQQESFFEFVVHNPDVAMIQFSVLEADVGLDDKVAVSTIPISCLRQGYRSILMHNTENGSQSGAFGFATLLTEIHLATSSN